MKFCQSRIEYSSNSRTLIASSEFVDALIMRTGGVYALSGLQPIPGGLFGHAPAAGGLELYDLGR
jgi:hypothetical protein